MVNIEMDREALTRFIEMYKSHTCLWNVSSADYNIKQKRINALQDLVPILGEAATIDSVRKKIDIIRNGYFRELKKVHASTSTETSANNVYTPSLWYFDLMSFLSSEKVSRRTDGFEEPVTKASGGGPSQIRRKKRRSTKTHRNVAKQLLTEDNTNIAAGQEDNTFGSYLNQQLQKLSNDQRILSEKLMSDVLFMARTDQLNATSHIVTRPSSEATSTITESQIYQNSPYSSSPQYIIYSPYSQDVASPPDAHISTPITVSPISQNSAHSSSPIQYLTSPSSSKGCIETQVSNHTPASANSLIQYQDPLKESPNTKFSLDDETENSAAVKQENKSILKKLLTYKKK